MGCALSPHSALRGGPFRTCLHHLRRKRVSKVHLRSRLVDARRSLPGLGEEVRGSLAMLLEARLPDALHLSLRRAEGTRVAVCCARRGPCTRAQPPACCVSYRRAALCCTLSTLPCPLSSRFVALSPTAALVGGISRPRGAGRVSSGRLLAETARWPRSRAFGLVRRAQPLV